MLWRGEAPLPKTGWFSGGDRRRWLCPIVCALVMNAPFVVFIKHENYGYLATEVLLIVAGMTAVAALMGFATFFGGTVLRLVIIGLLLFLFVDIQFGLRSIATEIFLLIYAVTVLLMWTFRVHIVEIVGALFGTMLLSTFLLPPSQVSQNSIDVPSDVSIRSDLPPVLHIVLDEHAGIDGLVTEVEGGKDLKRRLISFYRDHGFRLFGKSYSRYPQTLRSLSEMVSLTDNLNNQLAGTVYRYERTYRLKRHDYFERMQNAGYRLRIFQTSYLDFCGGLDATGLVCQTTNVSDLIPIRDSDFRTGQKASSILNLYLEKSTVYKAIKVLYGPIQNIARRNGIMLPILPPEGFRVSSLSATKVLKGLESSVSRATAGDFIFAHVLLPHYPYAFDSDCDMRTPDDWLSRDSRFVPGRAGFGSPVDFRHHLHQRYHQQVGCVYRVLEKIMDGINASGLGDRFIVILQGDHGSRIQSPLPRTGNTAKPSSYTFRQNYSTLLAVKAPGIAPGYSDARRAIQEIIKTLVESDFTSLSPTDTRSEDPYIFLVPEGDPLSSAVRRIPIQ